MVYEISMYVILFCEFSLFQFQENSTNDILSDSCNDVCCGLVLSDQ